MIPAESILICCVGYLQRARDGEGNIRIDHGGQGQLRAPQETTALGLLVATHPGMQVCRSLVQNSTDLLEHTPTFTAKKLVSAMTPTMGTEE